MAVTFFLNSRAPHGVDPEFRWIAFPLMGRASALLAKTGYAKVYHERGG